MDETDLRKNILDLEYQTYHSRNRIAIGLNITILLGVLSLGESIQSFLAVKFIVLELSLVFLGLVAYNAYQSKLETKNKIKNLDL